ncbi:hypothetical protein ElyMa_004214800 [Elysia marginata]|uniref:Uncharacterized protein n=1 Tax=Elysia marginata TaxID=1093978 RepID=A0AAV4GRV5_9GAST|nr:hypothetical protein ElyMa_004214800 [Elysia marginata]
MDYPYLNQSSFDTSNCGLPPGMDPGSLGNHCSMTNSYPDSTNMFSQMSQGYGRYNGVRTFPSMGGSNPTGLGGHPGSCSMMPRVRDHPHHHPHTQAPVFGAGQFKLLLFT